MALTVRHVQLGPSKALNTLTSSGLVTVCCQIMLLISMFLDSYFSKVIEIPLTFGRRTAPPYHP